MDNSHERLDPVLTEVVRSLRRPVPLSPDLDRRIMQQVRARPVRPDVRRIILGGGLALAAGIAGLLLALRSQRPASRPVHFAIQADSAASVAVVGDFNEWDPAGTPLERTDDGQWKVTLSLPPGRYRFSFLVDGRSWRPDPERPAVPDPDFQIPTSQVLVEGSAL